MTTNKCIAIIPARGGSKRIPKKNIRNFLGKPLIAYSIELALKSKLFSKVYVSTDDKHIKKIAEKYGAIVPYRRPKKLSDDYSTSKDAVDHTINWLKEHNEDFDYICTIYATSPLLKIKYLKKGHDEIIKNNCAMTFSVTSMPFPIQRTFKITSDNRCEMFTKKHYKTRSQDLEEAFQDAGQFYWENINIKTSDIVFGKDSIPIVLPRYLVQDIDTPEDWIQAEFMYKSLNQNLKNKDTLSKKIKHNKFVEKTDNGSKKRNILIRANSSSEIGTGHIMRDLVLANQYKNDNVYFACEDLNGNINHKISENNYELKILKSNNINELIKLINKYKIDMIIIDSYAINHKYEKKLKEKTNIKIFCLDDTYEKHHCDILLNHNIGAIKKKYKTLVPKYCDIKCGSKYTLLRDEFHKQKNKTNILLALGGTDSSNINIPILKILNTFQDIKINLVTTNSNRNINKLKLYTKNKSWIKLHIDTNKLAKLIKKSDFTIITPSVIANEVYFMNKPILAIKTAHNQHHVLKYLAKEKFMTLNKFSKTKFRKLITKVCFASN